MNANNQEQAGEAVNLGATFRDSNVFRLGLEMPAGLKHKPGKEYHWQDSEVLAWIAAQPVVLAYIFQRLSVSGAIVFDSDTRTWSGAAHKGGNQDQEAKQATPGEHSQTT